MCAAGLWKIFYERDDYFRLDAYYVACWDVGGVPYCGVVVGCDSESEVVILQGMCRTMVLVCGGVLRVGSVWFLVLLVVVFLIVVLVRVWLVFLSRGIVRSVRSRFFRLR